MNYVNHNSKKCLKIFQQNIIKEKRKDYDKFVEYRKNLT